MFVQRFTRFGKLRIHSDRINQCRIEMLLDKRSAKPGHVIETSDGKTRSGKRVDHQLKIAPILFQEGDMGHIGGMTASDLVRRNPRHRRHSGQDPMHTLQRRPDENSLIGNFKRMLRLFKIAGTQLEYTD